MFVVGLIVLTGWFTVQYILFLYNSAVVGGILSGSLHALTGSDHLAALLPLIFGKRWWKEIFHGMVDSDTAYLLVLLECWVIV